MSIYSEQPPDGVTREAVWRIPIEGPITYTLPLSPAAQAINRAIMEDSTASVDGYIDPDVHAVACPQCETDRWLTAEGNWRGDEPMRLACRNGHTWTPLPEEPDFGRGLMRQLILTASTQ
ncbi:hypothetical protein ABZ553_40935 [Streptomyces sparsogenes]|uniref:hypothetical protein n=1 Tax=Streptomyces sparsogenes TaxID=67365 RepID=UPI0034025FDA